MNEDKDDNIQVPIIDSLLHHPKDKKAYNS